MNRCSCHTYVLLLLILCSASDALSCYQCVEAIYNDTALHYPGYWAIQDEFYTTKLKYGISCLEAPYTCTGATSCVIASVDPTQMNVSTSIQWTAGVRKYGCEVTEDDICGSGDGAGCSVFERCSTDGCNEPQATIFCPTCTITNYCTTIYLNSH